MLISLYTSRAVLEALGETDFGIYNLVGGIVVLFSFMYSAMSAATQRFINYELGRGDMTQVKHVFSMSITVHIYVALLIFLLGETIGLWFVLTQLNIPLGRYNAAVWVYHLSLLGCCINILRIPYNACIIAYERMSFYAYASIIESVLKLAIVFLLALSKTDALILYALLTLAVISIVNFIYIKYCNRNFEISRYHYVWDKSLFKQLISFSGWSMFGSLATASVGQGAAILLNVFYGVVLNAALGIAQQIHSAVSSFVSSFQTAFSPQIIKNYASNQKKEFVDLICKTSRLSYCLVFAFAPALIVCISPFLHIWLTIVPEYTSSFATTSIILCMIDALSGPLWISVQATGNIKKYQILLSFISLFNLPIMYFMLIAGISPTWVIGVRAIIATIIHFVRIVYLGRTLNFPVLFYLKNVMLRVGVMTSISLPLSLYLVSHSDHFPMAAIAFGLIITQNIILIFSIGLPQAERKTIINFALNKIRKTKIYK